MGITRAIYSYRGHTADTSREAYTTKQAKQEEKDNTPKKKNNKKEQDTRQKQPTKNNEQSGAEGKKTDRNKNEQVTNKKRRPNNITYIQIPLASPFPITHLQDQQKRKAQSDLEGSVEREGETGGKQKEPPHP